MLGAGTGLALVWRQAWMPSLPRVTVNVSRQQEQPPPNAVNPSQAPAAAPVGTDVGGVGAVINARARAGPDGRSSAASGARARAGPGGRSRAASGARARAGPDDHLLAAGQANP